MEQATKEYTDELRGMGYSVEWIANAIRNALVGFKKYCYGVVNRPGMATKMARRRKKLVGKSTWFNKEPKNGQDGGEAKSPLKGKGRRKRPENEIQPVVESAIFVPHTPGGVLRDRLNKMEEGLNLTGRVKYVEELGSTLQEMLCDPDPWKANCGRTKCFPCRSQEGKCHTQGIERCKKEKLNSLTSCLWIRQ